MWGQQKQQLSDTDKKVFITPSLLDNHKQIWFVEYVKAEPDQEKRNGIGVWNFI